MVSDIENARRGLSTYMLIQLEVISAAIILNVRFAGYGNDDIDGASSRHE